MSTAAADGCACDQCELHSRRAEAQRLACAFCAKYCALDVLFAADAKALACPPGWTGTFDGKALTSAELDAAYRRHARVLAGLQASGAHAGRRLRREHPDEFARRAAARRGETTTPAPTPPLTEPFLARAVAIELATTPDAVAPADETAEAMPPPIEPTTELAGDKTPTTTTTPPAHFGLRRDADDASTDGNGYLPAPPWAPTMRARPLTWGGAAPPAFAFQPAPLHEPRTKRFALSRAEKEARASFSYEKGSYPMGIGCVNCGHIPDGADGQKEGRLGTYCEKGCPPFRSGPDGLAGRRCECGCCGRKETAAEAWDRACATLATTTTASHPSEETTNTP